MSYWYQIGQMWDFFRSDFSTFWRGAEFDIPVVWVIFLSLAMNRDIRCESNWVRLASYITFSDHISVHFGPDLSNLKPLWYNSKSETPDIDLVVPGLLHIGPWHTWRRFHRPETRGRYLGSPVPKNTQTLANYSHGMTPVELKGVQRVSYFRIPSVSMGLFHIGLWHP